MVRMAAQFAIRRCQMYKLQGRSGRILEGTAEEEMTDRKCHKCSAGIEIRGFWKLKWKVDCRKCNGSGYLPEVTIKSGDTVPITGIYQMEKCCDKVLDAEIRMVFIKKSKASMPLVCQHDVKWELVVEY